MDSKRSSIIGFALIGIILLGFSWYNSRQFEKNRRAAFVADSTAAAEMAARYEEAMSDTSSVKVLDYAPQTSVYRDSALNSAYGKEEGYVTISNDKLEIVLATKGAQIYKALIREYYCYDSTALNFIRPGKSSYNVSFFTDQNIDTENLVFDVVSATDSSAVMRLNFSNGGYVEQKYWLEKGSYNLRNLLSFVNMQDIVPRNMTSLDIDWNLDVPRIEKEYKTERQYSRIDYKFPGDGDVEKVGKGKDIKDEKVTTKLSWFAFQQHFFSAIMVAEKDFSSADFSLAFKAEDDADTTLMSCRAALSAEYEPAQVTEYPFSIYIGPNHYKTLKSHGDGFEEIVPLGGWLASKINKWVIIPLFNWLHKNIASYGIIILIMTLIIKLVISPLTIKSYMSSAKMSVIRPEMDKINEKYPKKEDAMKKQQALMDLYKRAGISPMGGCLPMLLQLPILYAMFRFFPTSFELRQQSFLWADDLSSYDSILDFGFRIPLLGDHLSLFALLMAVSMFLYSKMNSAQMSSDPNMAGMKFMTVWLMPIMMFFFCNSLSSGLSYYYMLSNIITIGQTWFIKKYVIDEKKIHAQLQQRSAQPPKKSRFMQRLEEAQKAQQQAMREQARKRR